MAKLKKDAEVTEKELRDYVWNYFQVHAAQRLTTFNFYIALSTAVTTGLFATLSQAFRVPLLGVVLGILLITFSFVFWKLDHRNRELEPPSIGLMVAGMGAPPSGSASTPLGPAASR